MAFQEALAFEENKTITNTDTLFKCEEGFYSAGQILATKDKELNADSAFSIRINNIIQHTYLSNRSHS
jgi:hypothetical protein